MPTHQESSGRTPSGGGSGLKAVQPRAVNAAYTAHELAISSSGTFTAAVQSLTRAETTQTLGTTFTAWHACHPIEHSAGGVSEGGGRVVYNSHARRSGAPLVGPIRYDLTGSPIAAWNLDDGSRHSNDTVYLDTTSTTPGHVQIERHQPDPPRHLHPSALAV